MCIWDSRTLSLVPSHPIGCGTAGQRGIRGFGGLSFLSIWDKKGHGTTPFHSFIARFRKSIHGNLMARHVDMPMDCPREKSVADETDGSMGDGFAALVSQFCAEQVALRARLAGACGKFARTRGELYGQTVKLAGKFPKALEIHPWRKFGVPQSA